MIQASYTVCSSLYHLYFQTKIFTQVKDVPKHFITSHMKLLGKVTEIGEFGILHIQHIPIVDMKVPFRPKKTGKMIIEIMIKNTIALDKRNCFLIIHRL